MVQLLSWLLKLSTINKDMYWLDSLFVLVGLEGLFNQIRRDKGENFSTHHICKKPTQQVRLVWINVL